MLNHPELNQWIDTVRRHFPAVSKPQALLLALWSFGMIIARSCGLSAVANVLALLLGKSFNTMRERLRDLYREADAKAGKKERNSMLRFVGGHGWLGYWMVGWDGN